MTRTYKKRAPYGKRGSYKPREQWAPRRSAAVAVKKAKLALKKPPTKKVTATNKKRPAPRAWRGEYGAVRSAITLAMNKLLEKPKYNCEKQADRRLRFWTVGYEECIEYMRTHPAACHLPKIEFEVGKRKRKCARAPESMLPCRATFYRILHQLGWTKEMRTRTEKRYPRRKQNL